MVVALARLSVVIGVSRRRRGAKASQPLTGTTMKRYGPVPWEKVTSRSPHCVGVPTEKEKASADIARRRPETATARGLRMVGD